MSQGGIEVRSAIHTHMPSAESFECCSLHLIVAYVDVKVLSVIVLSISVGAPSVSYKKG